MGSIVAASVSGGKILKIDQSGPTVILDRFKKDTPRTGGVVPGLFHCCQVKQTAKHEGRQASDMAMINVRKNEIQLKIVYYGPGRGGKTTSLEYIQNKLNGQGNGGLVKLKSIGDRTLFFDFYPMRIGRIRGYDVRVQLYSVPGQNRLQPLRKLVLKGVDSVVFVADAMSLRRKSNVESFQNLMENLRLYNKHLFHMPLTIQLNKVDLAEEQIPVISVQTLKSDLTGFLDDPALIENVPVFETSAASGKNVLKALESAIRQTVRRLDFNAIARMG